MQVVIHAVSFSYCFSLYNYFLEHIDLSSQKLNLQNYIFITLCYCNAVGFPNDKPFLAVYVSWQGENICNGKWQRSSCVLGIQDLPSIVSRKEFFVNKLEESYQPLAFACLEQWHLYKRNCPQQTDLTYYKNLPFVIKHKH